jgi:catechol 2,3-dioxygenase-like lactoylglutathione lyase family enzyme
MNVEFLSTVAVIAPDPPASRKLYLETLGLPLEGHGGDYFHSEQIAGCCKSFGIWPLSQAAEACFGTGQWQVERPVPQVSIEFDVADAARWGQRRGSSSWPATSCCTDRAGSRGARRSRGSNH